MGHILRQLIRIVMAAFWFTFIIIALNMARMAWPADPQGWSNYLTAAFFVVAAYAGFGMLIGMVAAFIRAREIASVR